MPDGATDHYSVENLREIHQRLNEAITSERIALREGIEVAIDPSSRAPFQMFCVDSSMAREMDNFIRASRNRKRLLDIGALHGVFSLVFTGRADTEAIAVEPSPPALSGLRSNCMLNPAHNVRVIDGALGASEAMIRMRHDGIHLIGADLVPHGDEPSMVKVVPGDALLADQRFAPDIIKIDVEGYEQQVLMGLSTTLDCLRPDLHIEVHGPWLPMFDGSTEAVFDLLQRHGYEVRRMDGQQMDAGDAGSLHSQMFHMFCTHRSTAWADRVRGCH